GSYGASVDYGRDGRSAGARTKSASDSPDALSPSDGARRRAAGFPQPDSGERAGGFAQGDERSRARQQYPPPHATIRGKARSAATPGGYKSLGRGPVGTHPIRNASGFDQNQLRFRSGFAASARRADADPADLGQPYT